MDKPQNVLRFDVLKPIQVGHVKKPLSARIAGFKALLAFDNWPMLLLNRVFERQCGLVVYRKSGLEILVDHLGGDENGTRQCITSSMYRKYLPSFDLSGPIRVLDLGANGGGFPLMLKIEGYDVVRAVCVELVPMTAMRLKVNLSTNFGPSAIALNAAVCDLPVDSEVRIKLLRGSTMESIFDTTADSPFPTELIKTITLQALYDRYFESGFIDLFKVDIEGAEYGIFEATPDETLRKIRYLLIELHDWDKTPSFRQRMTNLGFEELTIPADSDRSNATYFGAFRGPHA